MTWDWISSINRLKMTHERGVLVTVVKTSGSTPREVGAKMLVQESGVFEGTIGGGTLESLAIEEAKLIFASGESGLKKIPLGPTAGQCCGGTVELFFEVLNADSKCIIFGAGHVGQALSRVLQGTPFETHVIDSRKEWVKLLPDSGVIAQLEDPILYCEKNEAHFGLNTWFIVMTHSHALDEQLIKRLLKCYDTKPLGYLGLIGSQSKWARFQMRLKAQGMSQSSLSKVQCPIGLPIGGKSPQEVAISVAAELIQKKYDRRKVENLASGLSSCGEIFADGHSQRTGPLSG